MPMLRYTHDHLNSGSIRLRPVLLSLFLVFLFVIPIQVYPQFPPPAGQPGSNAIYKDSSILIGWANSCSVFRGFINIADTNIVYEGSNRASYGNEFMTADTADNFVLSLGDKGYATLGFENPITNGPGFDFAVFENGFGDEFLELAFVEVSSDGSHFVRFPAISLTQDSLQTGTFGTIDATKINNLAGKYRFFYGTPFDLEDLKDSVGIDLKHISNIRLVDVGGCIDNKNATYDSQGHKINDPWPTPFNTGGFDLDAIGVIHFASQGGDELLRNLNIQVFPIPVRNWLTVITSEKTPVTFTCLDLSGRKLYQGIFNNYLRFNISTFQQGLYIFHFSTTDRQSVFRKVFKN